MSSGAETARTDAAPRIAVLDGLRGFALLGIVAINVTGLWGPLLATFSPHLPAGAHGLDALLSDVWFALAFVVFEGKMRALFTLLFGASMLLFMAAARRAGANGAVMQIRRLGWLALFGYAHYLFLWWGDILFPYACCGMVALLFHRLDAAPLAALGLLLFGVSHGLDAVGAIAGIAEEQNVLAGRAGLAAIAEENAMLARIAGSIVADTAVLHAPFIAALRMRLASAPFLPFDNLRATFMETFPLMLIGMALMKGGFFTGGWSVRSLRITALAGICGGGAITLSLIGWWWAHGFPPRAMFAMLGSLTAVPHLAMGLGYAATFVLIWPDLSRHPIGRALAAAGRTAFTNYLGTSLVLGAVFSGWGLGLGERLDRAFLPGVVVIVWTIILVWPRRWLASHPQGPLETVWRRLTWWPSDAERTSG